MPWSSSADIGIGKPAAGAFEAAAERVGASLDRVLFVDDTLSHVEAARGLGMRAERFTDIDELRSVLTDLQLIR